MARDDDYYGFVDRCVDTVNGSGYISVYVWDGFPH